MTNLHEGGTAGAMLITAIERHCDRPAIADDRKRWTYRELGDEVGRLIAFFRSIGLKKGDAISALSPNRVEGWAIVCAAAIMGMRFTPLHPLAAEDDQAFIVEDAEIDALIVEASHFAERGRAIRARVPRLGHLLSIGDMAGARDAFAEAARFAPAKLVDGGASGEICWLAYTGGTTGRSKGVMIAHRCLVNMATIIFADWDWPSEIRYLAATPISHAGGVNIFPVMMRGGFVRLLAGLRNGKLLPHGAAGTDQRRLSGADPDLRAVDAVDLRARYDLSSLQMIVYGAAPMSPDRLLEALNIFGPVFVQLYGQTEAPQCVTTLRKVDHDPANPRRLGSCGRPNPLVDVKLFDLEMSEVEVGQPGEICVRGALS